MNIRRKKLLSVIISAVGIVAVILAFHYKGKLNSAQKGIDSAFSSSDNPFSKMIEEGAHHKLKGYEVKIHILMAIGAIVTALGISSYVYYHQKKS